MHCKKGFRNKSADLYEYVFLTCSIRPCTLQICNCLSIYEMCYYLKNEFDIWNVQGIMITLDLLQSKLTLNIIMILLVYCSSSGTQFFFFKIVHKSYFTLTVCMRIEIVKP